MTKRASYYTLPDGCSLYDTCNSCPYPDCQASLKDLKKRSLIDVKYWHYIVRTYQSGLFRRGQGIRMLELYIGL